MHCGTSLLSSGLIVLDYNGGWNMNMIEHHHTYLGAQKDTWWRPVRLISDSPILRSQINGQFECRRSSKRGSIHFTLRVPYS